MSRADETPRSVLTYVASDLLGDGLVKLPFARALRNAFPHAEIVWLAGKGTSAYAHSLAPLVEGLLDTVVEEAGVGRHWSEMTRPPLSSTPLAGRRFDLVIDTQRRLGTSLLLKRIPHGCFVSGAGGYLLSDRRPPRPRRKAPALVRRLLDLAALASGRPADITGTPPANPQADALAAQLLPEGPCYVGLAPGAAEKDRCWPLERYLALGAAQAAADRVPVFFLGPEEGRWTLPVREALPQAILPLQAEAVARLGPSPLITIALARRLAAAVANHAGIGHMMAAADCALVSLFGPTAPEKFAPLGGRARVLSAPSYGGTAMECIPLAAVQDAVESLLAGTMEERAARARPDGESRIIGGEAI
jgi:ADP-heptose:LPS heptosyltransferase